MHYAPAGASGGVIQRVEERLDAPVPPGGRTSLQFAEHSLREQPQDVWPGYRELNGEVRGSGDGQGHQLAEAVADVLHAHATKEGGKQPSHDLRKGQTRTDDGRLVKTQGARQELGRIGGRQTDRQASQQLNASLQSLSGKLHK